MDIRFAVPELDALDALKCEAILATCFSDDRPLSGVLGLIDWRMCGFLSRAIERGIVTGADGETVLLPLRWRFGVDKLFVLGLGPEASFDRKRLTEVTARMLEVATRAKVRTTALVLPGRSTAKVTPTDAMEGFVAAAQQHSTQDEFILLEPPAAQREMEPIVQRERRRARAESA